jgi:uncharacterized protein with HEPN domain
MFEIIGESLSQIGIHFPGDLDKLANSRHFIGFRNVLIHRYSNVDDTLVWGVIQGDLPLLRTQVSALMKQLDVDEPA